MKLNGTLRLQLDNCLSRAYNSVWDSGRDLISKAIREIEAIPDAHIVTVEDIYGTYDLAIPEGYQRVGFRIPEKGELVLATTSSGVAVESHSSGRFPSIILRRRKVTRKQRLFGFECV